MERIIYLRYGKSDPTIHEEEPDVTLPTLARYLKRKLHIVRKLEDHFFN